MTVGSEQAHKPAKRQEPSVSYAALILFLKLTFALFRAPCSKKAQLEALQMNQELKAAIINTVKVKKSMLHTRQSAPWLFASLCACSLPTKRNKNPAKHNLLYNFQHKYWKFYIILILTTPVAYCILGLLKLVTKLTVNQRTQEADRAVSFETILACVVLL